MDLEFTAGASRLEREHQKRAKEAAARLARENRAAELARQKEARMQEEIRISKQLRLEQQEKAEAERLAQEIATGGISYKKYLQVVPSASTGDKLSLPVSALAELTPQDAVKEGGVLCFEVSWKQGVLGAVTHAGVLDFEAAEGTVGVPLKVARSLCVMANVDIAALTHVTVRYVRLAKGSFARLQPVDTGFQQELDLKAVLERTLRSHTTLTEGDEVMVRYEGASFPLRVRELRPEAQVMIVNADVEVEVMPSEAALRAQAEAARLKAEAEAKALEEAQAAKRKEERRKLAGERLPQAVPAGSPGSIKCLIRTPKGSCTRVFHQSHSWAALFDLVHAEGGVEPPFHLVSSFPRRVYLTPDSRSTTFAQALSLSTTAPTQLALFVEFPPSSSSPSPSQSVLASSSSSSSSSSATLPVPSASSSSSRSPLLSPTTPPVWLETQMEVDRKLDAPDEEAVVPGMVRVEGASGTDREAKWASQLFELATMGFFDTERNITLLERYNGRTLRVINALSDSGPRETRADVPRADPPRADAPRADPTPAPSLAPENLYADELQQLESIGFSDRETNLQLLKRYQGRVVRVVNYLSEMHEGS